MVHFLAVLLHCITSSVLSIISNYIFQILNEKFKCQEPEPPFFAWSWSRLRDLRRPEPEPPKKMRRRNRYWLKDIPVPGTVPYTSVVELLLFCFVVFRISFFSSPDPDQTFFSESESESAEKSGSYPEKFGSGSMKKHPKTGVKVEKM